METLGNHGDTSQPWKRIHNHEEVSVTKETRMYAWKHIRYPGDMSITMETQK